MPHGIYERTKRVLNYYDKILASGLKLLDLINSGNQEEIDKFVQENEVPLASLQILTFFIKNEIPYESMSRIDRLAALEKMGYHGNQFAISSKMLINSLPKRNPEGELYDTNQQAYGLELLTLENIFYEYTLNHPSFINLSIEEREAIVEKKIQQFIENPEKFYPGIKKLLAPSFRSLSENPPEGMLESTRLYLFLYSQMFYKIEKEGEYANCPSFDLPKQYPRYYCCKVAEFYFNARFNTEDTGKEDSPDKTVFSRNGKPILIQKTGGKKTDYGNYGNTNATALSLEPIFVAGILYPPGTLFGVVKEGDPLYIKNLGNQHFDISEIDGLVPLRLSIYSISQEGNQRFEAFGNHYTVFKESITEPEGDLEDFKKVAQSIIDRDVESK